MPPDPRLRLNLVTPGGIPYAMEPYDGKYREQWSRDANQTVAHLRCTWDDSADFLKELNGYTTWDGVAFYLQRVPPLLNPYTDFQRCDSAELAGMGSLPERTDTSDPGAAGWVVADWVRYLCVFRRPVYQVAYDEEGYADLSEWEYTRYVSCTFRPVPREKRIAALELQTVPVGADPVATPLGEPGFIPDGSTLLYVTWHQVPVAAIPWTQINKSLDRVNATEFSLPLGTAATPIVCPVGSLLFKGLAQDQRPYCGADGDLYYDLTYVFDFKPTLTAAEVAARVAATEPPGKRGSEWGWNGFQLIPTATDQMWRQVVWRKATSVSPYQYTEHQNLFIPGA